MSEYLQLFIVASIYGLCGIILYAIHRIIERKNIL